MLLLTDGAADDVVAATAPAQPAGPPPPFVGLTNQGATCYLNSLLQSLFMAPEFTRALFSWQLRDGDAAARAKSIPHQLQMLFAQLLTAGDSRAAVSTVDLTKSFEWGDDQAFVQHDVQELCRLLFDQLELAFKGTEQEHAIANLYKGELVDFIQCKPPHTHESARTDCFMDLQLAVKGFGSAEPIRSVFEGLRNFLTSESLEGPNQYALGDERVDAWKGLRLSKLPALLTIHLKRFDLDYTSMRRIKLNDRVEFSQRLRFEYQNSRASVDGDGTVVSGWIPLEEEPEEMEQEIAENRVEYELYSVRPNTRYLLCKQRGCGRGLAESIVWLQVLVHAGTAQSGHYYAFIRDVSRGRWLRFDDSSVTFASWEDVQSTFGASSAPAAGSEGSSLFARSSGAAPPLTLRSTTAYMLTYRMRGGANDAEEPGGVDPLDPLAVPVPPSISEALEADRAAKAAAAAAKAERDAMVEITVHFAAKLVQLSFRRGHTVSQLIEAVAAKLGKPGELTASNAHLCLLDTRDYVVRGVLPPEAALDPDKLPAANLVCEIHSGTAPRWFFGEGEAPLSERAMADNRTRGMSVSLLHVVAGQEGVVGSCDVTLGGRAKGGVGSGSPACTLAQVRRAAGARFGLSEAEQQQCSVYRGRYLNMEKGFERIWWPNGPPGEDWKHGCTSAVSWGNHPVVVVEQPAAEAASTASTDRPSWSSAATERAARLLVCFTDLDADVPTHRVLFDARRTTDELKAEMADVLSKELGETVSVLKFNALNKSKILNQPDKPPFNVAKFKQSGFTRWPFCQTLRLQRGAAVDQSKRVLVVQYHVPNGPGLSLWKETVDAKQTLDGYRAALAARIQQEAAAGGCIPEMRAVLDLDSIAQGKTPALRLRLYDAETGRPGKVLFGGEEEMGSLISLASTRQHEASASAQASAEAVAGVKPMSVDGPAPSAELDLSADIAVGVAVLDAEAGEEKLTEHGHSVVTLARWQPAAGKVGKAVDIVVESSITGAALADRIAGIGSADCPGLAVADIGLRRHWPRQAKLGAPDVITKSWSVDAFDASVSPAVDGLGLGEPKRRLEEDEEEESDQLRDGDIVYWRDNRESASLASPADENGSGQKPKKKKKRQQTLAGFFKKEPALSLGSHS